MARTWDQRYAVARDVFVPWIAGVIPLAGARVVDFGGGAGSMAMALAPQVGSIELYDEAEGSVAECVQRGTARGVTNVRATSGAFAELIRGAQAQRGAVDVFLLFAVLEHMTIAERLETLTVAAEVLTPDGAIVVVETPNRLLWHDYHTTETPFFGMLPDELALDLADTIRRRELAEQLVAEADEATRRLLLTRFGRGVSHHEFEAVFGPDVHRHVVATGWDPTIFPDRPEYREERYLDRFLAAHEPHVASCFSRYWVDLILQPGRMVPRPLPRPWPVQSLGSDRVAITSGETALIGAGGTLRAELPAAAHRVAVRLAVGGGEAPELRLRSGGDDLAVRPSAEPGVQQVVVELPAPTTSIELHVALSAVEVVSVLTWPVVGSDAVPALPVRDRRAVATAISAGVAVAAAPPPPHVGQPTDGLHGTYVGDGRVLVRVRGGGRLLVSSGDISLMPELVAEGGYDAPFTAFLRRTLGPGSTFVDVGANVGLFTVIGALQGSRVVAYEPAPDLVALLRDNVQLNWLTGRVTIRDAAVADLPGKRPFRFDRRMQLTGRLDAEPGGGPLVEVVTLDDELGASGPIDLVKIDVEGGEAAALAGMASLLGAGAVAQISCEVRTDNFAAGRQDPGWAALVERLGQLEATGWSTALIDSAGQLVARTLDEIVASEPHPNVVLGRP